MTRIDIQVIGASITAEVNGKLTSGQIGAQAYFSFSPEWSGLNKIAVFRGSGKVKDRALAGSTSTTIPWEVLTQPNTRLEIGVEGRNIDGSIVFPTVWCFADSVAPGANAVADPGIAPTPNVYDDIMAAVGNLPGLKTEAKENLVAAINELYERGGGSADPEAVANLVEQYLKENPPAPGEAGYSPTITTAAITGGTRLTITDINGTKTVDVVNGKDGEPYELTAEDEAKLVAAMLAADEIAQMRQDLDDIRADLDYKAIDITNFGCSAAGTHELGSAVTGMSCYWSLNKEPTKQTLRSETLENSVRSKQYTDLNITSNTTVTLSVTDERGATDSASSSISFLNCVYHGVIADGADVNNAAVLALTRSLQGSRGITFTANAGAGQRIAYAIPSRYGTPVFTVGGFEGGFSKAATISFTNASGYTENYDVWLSDNVALGSTTVKVS